MERKRNVEREDNKSVNVEGKRRIREIRIGLEYKKKEVRYKK